jgi:hypothetical protein
MKFYEHLTGGGRIYPCGQNNGRTDRHNKASNRCLQLLCEHSLKLIELIPVFLFPSKTSSPYRWLGDVGINETEATHNGFEFLKISETFFALFLVSS